MRRAMGAALLAAVAAALAVAALASASRGWTAAVSGAFGVANATNSGSEAAHGGAESEAAPTQLSGAKHRSPSGRVHTHAGSGGSERTTPWGLIVLAGALVLVGGALSGLLIGMFSLDPLKLALLEMDQFTTARDRELARRVQSLLQCHHLLLVALILGNSAAMCTLPVVLDRLVPSWLAVLLAVSLSLVFAEIVPQAVVVRHALAICGNAAPFVWCLVALTFPVAYPVSKLLDALLGPGGATVLFSRQQLLALIDIHRRRGEFAPALTAVAVDPVALGLPTANGAVVGFSADSQVRTPGGSTAILPGAESAVPAVQVVSAVAASERLSGAVGGILRDDEANIISGTLQLTGKRARDALTSLDQVFMLSDTAVLDEQTLEAVQTQGHSRIPVYSGTRDCIKGLLLAKQLVLVSPAEKRSLATFPLRAPLFVSPGVLLFDLLNAFRRGSSHMAIVTEEVPVCDAAEGPAPPGVHAVRTCTVVHGVITLEDVLEEVVGDIADESDARKASLRPRGSGGRARLLLTVKRAAAKFKEMLSRRRARARALATAAAAPPHIALPFETAGQQHRSGTGQSTTLPTASAGPPLQPRTQPQPVLQAVGSHRQQSRAPIAFDTAPTRNRDRPPSEGLVNERTSLLFRS